MYVNSHTLLGVYLELILDEEEMPLADRSTAKELYST